MTAYLTKLLIHSSKWTNPFITISSKDAANYACMKIVEKDGSENFVVTVDKKKPWNS